MVDTCLLTAARHGNIEHVKSLIEQGSKINIQGDDGHTPLSAAIKKYKWEVAEFLVARGADIKMTDKCGKETFKTLVKKGQLNLIKHFIEHGTDIHILDSNLCTPLVIAIWHKKWEVAKFLLDKGATIFQSTHDSIVSVLHVAVLVNRLDMIHFIIEQGTDIEMPNLEGSTPLLLAILNGQWEVTEFLIDKGADIKAANGIGFTPLHAAASRGKLDVVKYIIEHGTDIDVQDNEGFTPLHCAIFNEEFEVVDFLIANGADNKFPRYDNIVRTLHTAISHGKLNAVKFIIEHEVQIDIQNEQGYTPLHEAIRHRKLEIAEFFISKGADINTVDIFHGCTPLHEAASQGTIGIINTLIQKGADIDAKNKLNETPLHKAALFGCIVCVTMLLHWGASTKIKENSGLTAEQFTKAKKVKLAFKLHSIKLSCLSHKYQAEWKPCTAFGLFPIRCFLELERIKNTMHGVHSLFDVLTRSHDPWFVTANTLEKELIKNKFPIYQSLLRVKWFKAKQRFSLLNELHSYYNIHTLPEMIRRMVLSYLSDITLTKTIMIVKENFY